MKGMFFSFGCCTMRAKASAPICPSADVLVAVGVGAERGLGIVSVNHPNFLDANRRVELLHGSGKPFGRVDGVPRFKTVGGIDARADRQVLFRARDDLRHFLEAAANGRSLPGGVFNQNGQAVELQSGRRLEE